MIKQEHFSKLSKAIVFVCVVSLIAQTGPTTFAYGRMAPENANAPVMKDVIIGFHENRYDPGVVSKAEGKVRAELFPFVDAIAVTVPENQINALLSNPNVRYVEEDFKAFALGHVEPTSIEYTNSWGVDHINSDTVYMDNTKQLGNGIDIAIIDTGMDYNHPDLRSSYRGGYDFVNKDSDPMDDNNHGTHVAGIISAEKNDMGVVGVAPSANLYALKVLGSDGSGSYSDIVLAINWAVENKMEIASMSLGGTASSVTLADAVKKAHGRGLLMVAAAGNDGTNRIYYPAAYSQVIAVGATDSSDKKAYFSNTGKQLELVAPGVSIKSTVVGGGYASYSGTSMATPHVSGVAALVWSNGIATTNTAVRDVLQKTANDLGISGRDSSYGYGIVDAAKASGIA